MVLGTEDQRDPLGLCHGDDLRSRAARRPHLPPEWAWSRGGGRHQATIGDGLVQGSDVACGRENVAGVDGHRRRPAIVGKPWLDENEMAEPHVLHRPRHRAHIRRSLGPHQHDAHVVE